MRVVEAALTTFMPRFPRGGLPDGMEGTTGVSIVLRTIPPSAVLRAALRRDAHADVALVRRHLRRHGATASALETLDEAVENARTTASHRT